MADENLISLTPDNGVRKRILKTGDGSYPTASQRVEVFYTSRRMDGTKFDEINNKEDPYSFFLQENKVIKAWDIAVASMQKGELAIVYATASYCYGINGNEKFDIKPNEDLQFEIEVVNFYNGIRTKWDYTAKEREELAMKWKSEGNDFFKNGNFDEAKKKYSDSLNYVENEKGIKLLDFKISCMLNMSMCNIKLKEYSNAIDNATGVLSIQPENVKALYRRGLANVLFGNFEEAQNDFSKVLEIEPDNSETKNQLEELKKRRNESNKKEKKMFGNIFKQEFIDSGERSEYSDPSNPLVFLDISIGGAPAERIIIELFSNLVPKTAENFRSLCTGEKGVGKNALPLSYKNTKFHRLSKDFILEGGDFVKGDGNGGESIYGDFFDDENFKASHLNRGFLSMSNCGKNSNSSRFYITFKKTYWMDKLNVVFGNIIKNKELLNKIEAVECEKDVPKIAITIINCGEIKENKFV